MKKGISDTCYRFFDTLANPTRLAVLENLRESPLSVTQLMKALGQEQSMVSHNLRPLVRCGFVRVERVGKERVYDLNRETFEALLRIVENHAAKYCPTGGLCHERGVEKAGSKAM